MFLLWGRCWWSEYAGKPLPLPACRGFALINYLMQHPRVPVDCRELALLDREPLLDSPPSRANRTTDEVSESSSDSDLRSHSRSTDQAVLDPNAIKQILARKCELLEQLNDARRREDFQLEAKCEEELEKINTYVLKNTFR